MRLKNQILAGVIAASVLFTSFPAVNVSAAKLKYAGTYTKEIDIEEAAPASAASTGGNDSATIIQALATTDNAVIDTNNSAAAGQSTDTGSGTEAATVNTQGATPFSPAAQPGVVMASQEENVRVMTGMKFVIGVTRYGTLVKTTKNKSAYKFRSSNKKIAKVSAKGVVTTVKAGKCDITITDKKDGNVYLLHLTVAKTVKVKNIKLNETSKEFKKDKGTFQLTATVKPAKYAEIPVLWGSTDDSVATVDNRGLVTIKGFGDCEIYCKAGSNNKVAKCSVKVKDPNANENAGGGNTGYNQLTYRTGKLVDISSHNTVSNWQQLKNSCDGVIIRVGYRGYSGGTLQEDIKFRSNVYNCQQHGIPFSVYFFTTAVNEAEGVEEANWIANELAGMSISMPVFIDSESSGGSGRSDRLSKAQRTAAVKAACAQLAAKGIPSGVYASTSWLYNNLDMGQIPYSVWAADYRGYCGYTGSKFAWQYTSSATGYGVANRCDVSNWYN
ncbi:GH25 family lysozyme [Butyrivibrio sp. WCE2006]|uniref:GH25 family lysozyme n=1 Tax=Butyrivibrio sp. WCE2006 TaxID=1410611 RepID=UPI0006787175|nr:GH25 family lysozyme [Butyrivibrio sp. WCE2006]